MIVTGLKLLLYHLRYLIYFFCFSPIKFFVQIYIQIIIFATDGGFAFSDGKYSVIWFSIDGPAIKIFSGMAKSFSPADVLSYGAYLFLFLFCLVGVLSSAEK